VERLGGLAERKTLFDSLKTADPSTVFFDTGDFLSIRSSMNDDDIVSAVYPALGYDAVAVGDQELINGLSFFKAKLAGKLPFVSSNLEFADKEINPAKYKIIETANGIKVGVTGINFNTNFRYLYRSSDLKETDLIVDKAFDSLRPVLSELRKKTDIVVVLAHLNEEGIIKVIDSVEDFDLLIGGNNQMEYQIERRIGKKIHVQNGRDGEKIGKVVYSIDNNGKPVFQSYELIKVLAKKYERDEAIESVIKKMER
jgi:2',3'-cyclic-nucleotide 2'-phosphodiesterase (5'-nucleotidase family)